jgi:hypothetical protein
VEDEVEETVIGASGFANPVTWDSSNKRPNIPQHHAATAGQIIRGVEITTTADRMERPGSRAAYEDTDYIDEDDVDDIQFSEDDVVLQPNSTVDVDDM